MTEKDVMKTKAELLEDRLPWLAHLRERQREDRLARDRQVALARQASLPLLVEVLGSLGIEDVATNPHELPEVGLSVEADHNVVRASWTCACGLSCSRYLNHAAIDRGESILRAIDEAGGECRHQQRPTGAEDVLERLADYLRNVHDFGRD